MKGLPALTDFCHSSFQDRVIRQASLADLLVNSRKVLIHDPSAADIQMAYFGISHLSFRKAYCQP